MLSPSPPLPSGMKKSLGHRRANAHQAEKSGNDLDQIGEFFTVDNFNMGWSKYLPPHSSRNLELGVA